MQKILTQKILITSDQYEDLLFFQELEQERKTAEWEAPFPMTARTQQDMAENEAKIVQDGIKRFVSFMGADAQTQAFSSPF